MSEAAEPVRVLLVDAACALETLCETVEGEWGSEAAYQEREVLARIEKRLEAVTPGPA